VSTKILDGYKRRNKTPLGLTLSQASSLCEKHRQETQGLLLQMMIQKFQRNSWTEAGRAILRNRQLREKETSVSTILETTGRQLRWEGRKATTSIKNKQRVTDFDLLLDICIFPQKENQLMLVFAENPSIIQKIIKELDLLDYHYQNASDKPKNVSAEDWQKRAADWKDVYPEVKPPVDVSWSISSHSIDEYCALLKRIVLTGNWQIPQKPKQEESRRAARNALVEKELGQKHLEWQGIHPGEQCPMHKFSHWYSNACHHWNIYLETEKPETPEGQQLETLAAEILQLPWI
jgi:hypothetical protein